MTRAVGEPLIRTRRWTRREYDRLIELGMLHEDEPIELLAGRLVVREPQRTPHAVATQLAAEALRTAFGAGWMVRVQLPLALDDESEPEPDVTVVRGAPRDYLRDHPSAPALVVEVAHVSLRADRIIKARLYARAGIEEYWIVNLVDRVLEVYRAPTGRGSGRRAAPMPTFDASRRRNSSRRSRRRRARSQSPTSCPETARGPLSRSGAHAAEPRVHRGRSDGAPLSRSPGSAA